MTEAGLIKGAFVGQVTAVAFCHHLVKKKKGKNLHINHSHPHINEDTLLNCKSMNVSWFLCGDTGCWALESCGAVQLCSPRRASYLLHAYKQWGGRHLLQQFHHSPLFISSNTLIHFVFLREQLATSESIPGYIKMKCSTGRWAGGLPFPSLFVP